MKKLIIYLLFFASTIAALSQTNTQPRKWKLHSVGFRVQPYFSQKMGDLSHESMLALAHDPYEIEFDMTDYIELANFGLEAATFGIMARLDKPINYGFSHIIELGASIYIDTEILVDYEKMGGDPYSDYIGWCIIMNKLDFELSYYLDKSLFQNWNIRIGPTLLAGSSFDDELILMENGVQEYQTTPARSVRYLYAQMNYQLSRTFWKRYELGIGMRFGQGLQLKEGERVRYDAFHFSMAYVFN